MQQLQGDAPSPACVPEREMEIVLNKKEMLR
jgi:hypothetical protein